MIRLYKLLEERTGRQYVMALSIAYVVYCTISWLSGAFDTWAALGSWRLVQWALTVVAPAYLIAVWKARRTLCVVDTLLPVMALSSWVVATVVRADLSKGLMNLLLIEPSIVGLCVAPHAVTFLGRSDAIAAPWRRRLGVIAVCIAALSAATAYCVPGLKD